MALIYNFKVTDPSNVGAFPPSVTESDWYKNLSISTNQNSILINTESFILFEDEAHLQDWVSNHTLTDSALLADVATWKSAHGISYSVKVLSTTDSSVSAASVV